MHPLTPSKLASLKLRAGPGARRHKFSWQVRFTRRTRLRGAASKQLKCHKKQAETSHHNPARFLSEVEVSGTVTTISEHLRSVACSKLQARGSPNHLDRSSPHRLHPALTQSAREWRGTLRFLWLIDGVLPMQANCKPGERAPRVRTSPARPHASSGTSPRVVTVTAEQ